MRTGVLGGSFDPVHLAHLIMAEQCREQAHLDRVLFTLAARPPHKLGQTLTPFHHRQEMLELAIAGYPAFQVSLLEKDRPGPSYTVDTLSDLRNQHPGDELLLIVGSDCLADLPTWREPKRIAALAELLVVARPGAEVKAAPDYFKWTLIQSPLIGISSSDLRKRVVAGKSIRYMVPRAVECYIEQHLLYAPAISK